MRILILGGDGYLGWPTAMRFSTRGHEVSIVDNFSRRRWHTQLSTDSLTPIASLTDRIEAWRENSGNEIARLRRLDRGLRVPRLGDRRDPARGGRPLRRAAVGAVLDEVARARGRDPGQQRDRQPQPAVRDPRPRARLPPGQARDDGRVRDARTSTSRRAIIEIEHNGRKDTLPFPKLPGSLYHLSKVHDSHNIHFACRIWGLRATDLNQGVVYGIETDESGARRAPGHALRLRRVLRHGAQPLLRPGRDRPPADRLRQGGQTRGFLNIRDTLQCVELAVDNPAGLRRVPRLQPVHRAVLASPSWPSWSARRGRDRPRRRDRATTRTRASRPRSTTTTQPTPSCSTWGSSRTSWARSWSARCSGSSSAIATG